MAWLKALFGQKTPKERHVSRKVVDLQERGDVDGLLRLLEKGLSHKTEGAARAIGELADIRTINELGSIIVRADPPVRRGVRREATKALGFVKHDQAAAAQTLAASLIDWMNHYEYPYIDNGAHHAMAVALYEGAKLWSKPGPPPSEGDFTRVLHDAFASTYVTKRKRLKIELPNSFVFIASFNRLGKHSVQPLCCLFVNENLPEYVGHIAKQALRQIGSDLCFDQLRSETPKVETIALACQGMGWTPGTDDVCCRFHLALRDWSSVVKYGEICPDTLASWLVHPDDEVRSRVRGILLKTRSSIPRESIFSLLSTPKYVVRAELCDFIAKKSLEGAEAALWPMLSESDQEVRFSAARALFSIASEPLVELREALSSSNWKIRQAATSQMSSLCPPFELVRMAVCDEHPAVRSSAVSVLAKQEYTQETSFLVKMLEDKDWNVRAEVQDVLIRVGKRALEPLFEVLRTSHDSDVRYRALEVIHQYGGEKSKKAIAIGLHDKDAEVRRLAAVWQAKKKK